MAIDLITAVPTPFTEEEHLDRDGVHRLFADLASRPIDGVMIAGTTGEFTTLSLEERSFLFKAGVEAFGAERSFPHVGATHAREAIALAQAAVEAGATKLVAITPYYFPAPPEASVEYFRRLCEAVPDTSVYAYLFRARTTTVTPVETLASFQEVGVTGVKISGESDETVSAYLAAAPEGFEVYSGNDVSFEPFVAAGGIGVISGVSSVFPEPFIAMRDALRAGDDARVAKLRPLICRLVDVVRAGGIGHLKAGLDLRGVPGGRVRSAVEAVEPHEREAIARALEEVRGE